MWIGTWSGLYRFDGYDFVTYKHDPENSSSLGHNTVSTLYQDNAGDLWIGSPIGLDRLDRASGVFCHYVPDPSNPKNESSNSVLQICEGNNGDLWIGTGVGIRLFDRGSERFTRPQHDTSDAGDVYIGSIFRDKGGSLWIGTSTGLARYDAAARRFAYCWSDPGNRNKLWINSTSTHWVNSIWEDEHGTLWLGTCGGLVEYKRKEGEFSTHRYSSAYRLNPQHPENRILSVCQDAMSGTLWLGSRDGLFSFDRSSKTFIRRLNYGVTTICGEKSGTLWVGMNTGVKKLNRPKQVFKKVPVGDIVCALVNGGAGTIWVYAYKKGGWLRFDTRRGEFIPYAFGRDYLYFAYPNGDLSFLKSDGGFYIQDTLGRVTFSLGPSRKDFNHSFSFGLKTDKGYYIGTHAGGLYFFDAGTQRVIEIRQLKQDVYYLYEDGSDLVWAATRGGGLFCYDQSKNRFFDDITERRNLPGESASEINQIYEDKRGRLWFATVSGLDCYDHSIESFTHTTERNGLASNNIRGILEDGQGVLWLNTTRGILKFDPDTHSFRYYDVSYGLDVPSNIYYGWGCKSPDGEMFFAGATALTRFHPDSIRDNLYVPPIVITSFLTFGKPHPVAGDVHLAHDENFISFEFSALSYVSPEKNQYAYTMVGVDNSWVDAGPRRFASYPNLDPGEYVFKVKGANNEGSWNEVGTSMTISISPPWWKSVWAYIAYTVSLLCLGYLVWKTQVRRLQLRHEYEMTRFEAIKLHEVDQMKSRFFANISHEFRTPLTLILGPIKEVIDASDDEALTSKLKVVSKNARRLLGLVNQLLDLSKIESGNMRLQAVPRNVVPLVQGLTQAFSSYAERKRISLNVRSTQDTVIAYIDLDKMEKILTNVLSNAFKFTPVGGRIDVSVEDRAENVILRVADTGIGIPAEKLPKVFDRFYQVDGSQTREHEGSGIGLSLTRELVELHKGKIDIDSVIGQGTTVTIFLPLGKDHLKPEEICAQQEEESGSLRFPKVPVSEEDQRTGKPLVPEGTTTDEAVLLLVEDNADVRAYIGRNLPRGYRVLEADDGEDGLKKSMEEIPDIIVSDVMMPKMDGYELCRRLKTDERTSHIPIILLTAKASSQDKIEGYSTGADDYIMKPFEPDELSARIHNLIEQRARIHEHFRNRGLFEIEEKRITPLDKKFIQRAVVIITEHISDPGFGVETLAAIMAVSSSVLLKKIQALVGEPPVELIKRIRLNRAAQLIEGRAGNISEIALEVGFSNPSYFSECFRKQFGCTPTHYHRNTTRK